MPRVSADRLLDDLVELAGIGGRPDGGVDRIAGSDADVLARRWLVERMGEAGLEAGLDEVNNVFGHPPGRGPWLLLGSHTDTVPAGGRLDGAYGVLAALEVARTLPGRVAVASFHDEEGVTGHGFAGSMWFCAGPQVELVSGYLELHVEQGPRLEAEGLELGVVGSIVGIDRYEVSFRGAANHAGTTPFALRRDAGRAAARAMAGLRELVLAIDPEMVANVGQVSFEPGAPNVVPGIATFQVEMRAAVDASLKAGEQRLRGEIERIAAEEGCQAEVRSATSWPPVAMFEGYVAALSRVCERSGRPWRLLDSGAGHDAEILASHVPAGMLFVPSHDGVSHSPLERTDDRLLVQGCQALADSVLEILGPEPPS
ncbi:MAG: hydantoinase/carbamoylase family amidase [Chloroflexi bacterium]|nr:MAG: hydantoinase/carbamoylase family amidase [Chloroflexota bacterium]TME18394.1 MAG: hydantoinase/carbamoylase family amidase [Chloroflexota bacterium]